MNTLRLLITRALYRGLPETRAFRIKSALLRWAGATIGDNVRITSSARIYGSGELTIGDNTWIGHETTIHCSYANVSIGKNVDIAPRVLIVAGTHKISTAPSRVAGEGIALPISVGDGTWIGAGSIIIGGVKVGHNCLIGAGSVVNRNIDPMMFAAQTMIKQIKPVSELANPNG